MSKMSILLCAIAVLWAAGMTPIAHYTNIGTHESLHCLWQVTNDTCEITITRAPAIDSEGASGRTMIDKPVTWWSHLIIYSISFIVSGLLYLPAVMIAYKARGMK